MVEGMPQSAKAAAANTEASSEGVQARCDAWWQRMLESRDPDGPVHPTLPPDVAPVQTRLVRAVGRGTLADGRSVYLKAMDFPRWKDRLRYLFRALPAAHEAALLREVAATGLNCPVVVYAATARRWAMPWRSLLITEALPVAAQSAQKHGPVTWSEASAVAARLAEAGVFHPDLHRLNLERLDDGGVAVLDLQSARARGVSLKAAERLHMAAKLLAEPAERGLLDQLRAGCDKAGLLASPSAALGSGREISGSDASDAVAPNSKLATEAAGLPGDGGHGDSGAVAGGPEISSAAVTAVVASGLLPEVSAGALAASAAGTALEGFRRLISRCLRTSTQTVVRRRPWATTWLRRGLDAERATAIAVAVREDRRASSGSGSAD